MDVHFSHLTKLTSNRVINCFNKCRVFVCWGLLISKLVIHSYNVLILEVDIHLSHISQPRKFHCHIISIGEVVADFWYKNFRLNFEGLLVLG